MKKSLLLAFILFFGIAQAQVISINPNSGTYGQTLTTTITLANGTLTMASPPMQMNDIYLQQGTTFIYATNYSLYPGFPSLADSISATFDIPQVTPPGPYDVHVTTYSCAGCPFPTPNDNILTAGFHIGNVAGLIEGTVYYDANQNGIRDTNEVGLSNRILMVNPIGYTAVTDINGHYSIASDTGTNTISVVVPSPFTQTSLPSTYTITVPPDSLGNDFGLYAPPSAIYTQSLYVTKNNMRCNSQGYSGWRITSTSPMPHKGSVTVIYSPNLTYVNAGIAPTTISTNTLRWDYTLAAFTTQSSTITYMDPPAGDTVSYVVIDSVADIAGNFQTVYLDSFKVIVRCSWDPNDKSVSPEGDGGSHYTLKNSQLEYTIRFQNTGNDTAFNVLVVDTLDTDLDLNSIEIVGSSHLLNVLIYPGQIVHFNFDNILLPDSNVDEEHSHGFVAYRINPNPVVSDNTPVTNTAYIYFDFNPAVITNTTLNTLVTTIPVAVDEPPTINYSHLYPNPLTDGSKLTVSGSSSLELRIFDSTGREILKKNISGNYLLSKSNFKSGVYLYQLRDTDGSLKSSGKFLVVE